MYFYLGFNICSLFVLITLIYFYFRQKRMFTWQYQVYAFVLVLMFFCTLIDTIASYMDMHVSQFPLLLVNTGNILYLCLSLVAVSTFYMYGIILANAYHKRSIFFKIAVIAPLTLGILLILSSPFTSSVFYIDSNHNYSYGPAANITYIIMIYYLAGIVLTLIHYHNRMAKAVRRAIIIFLLLITSAAVIQFYYPSYLLLNFATTISLLIMYLSLQSPELMTDQLTGNLNRNVLNMQLDNYIITHKECGIICVSTDNFKNINSLLGSKNADNILIEIGNLLSNITRSSFTFRSGGDNFIILLPKVHLTEENFRQYAPPEKYISTYAGLNLEITFTITGFNATNYENTEDFITDMDYILSYQKVHDKSSVKLIDEEYRQLCFREAHVEQALKNAMFNHSLEVYYQPIISTVSSIPDCAEALVRLIDPELGFIPPDEFIPIAEKKGLINELELIVLDKICNYLSEHDIRKYGYSHIDFNLSAIHSIQDNLTSGIMSILNKYNVSPELIVLEITETAAISSIKKLQENLDELCALGFKIYVDDFGTGYSNLNYLFQLPLTAIKFDKSMLWSSFGDERKNMIFSKFTQLIRDFGASVVVEGAETPEHINYIKNLNIEYIQGYYYSKPINGTEFFKYISANKQ